MKNKSEYRRQILKHKKQLEGLYEIDRFGNIKDYPILNHKIKDSR